MIDFPNTMILATTTYHRSIRCIPLDSRMNWTVLIVDTNPKGIREYTGLTDDK